MESLDFLCAKSDITKSIGPHSSFSLYYRPFVCDIGSLCLTTNSIYMKL